MGLAAAIADDYLVWDDPETVTYRSLGNSTVSVAYALRLGELGTERAPSGGVYTSADVGWMIPASLLGAIRPKPGDAVLSGSDVYTVLDAGLLPGGGEWSLRTRELRIANGLNDTVDIVGLTATLDSYGSRITTEVTLSANVACRIQQTGSEEATIRDSRGPRLFYDVFMAEDVAGLNTDCKLSQTETGSVYKVLSVQNRQRIDELSVVKCVVES